MHFRWLLLFITLFALIVPREALAQAITITGPKTNPHEGLAQLTRAEADPALAGHFRVDAVRAHLLDMAGDHDAAREHYRAAARRTLSVPEQRYLHHRAAR